ncbi:hypothetical protein CPB84DRAFT_1789866, partial [Gymnopilus junonius]
YHRPGINLLRRRTQIPKRLFVVSTFKAQIHQPRAPGVLARIRYRSDGNPRSLLMGAAGVAIAILTSYYYYITRKMTAQRIDRIFFMMKGVLILKIDREYDNVDFEDPVATLEYFKKLYSAVLDNAPDEVDERFRALDRMLKPVGTSVLGDQVQLIMKDAAERVHIACSGLGSELSAPCARLAFVGIVTAALALMALTVRLHSEMTKERMDAFKSDFESRTDYKIIGERLEKAVSSEHP